MCNLCDYIDKHFNINGLFEQYIKVFSCPSPCFIIKSLELQLFANSPGVCFSLFWIPVYRYSIILERVYVDRVESAPKEFPSETCRPSLEIHVTYGFLSIGRLDVYRHFHWLIHTYAGEFIHNAVFWNTKIDKTLTIVSSDTQPNSQKVLSNSSC